MNALEGFTDFDKVIIPTRDTSKKSQKKNAKAEKVRRTLHGDISLFRNSNGKWQVRFNLDDAFGNVIELLRHGLDKNFDLSGTLEEGKLCGVFADCGYEIDNAVSSELTEKQANKVRKLLTDNI